MIFTSRDRQFSLILADSFLPHLVKWITKSKAQETGGIIIGNYDRDQSVAIVKKLTGPPKDSLSGFTWFQRGLKGLQQLLNRYWKKNEYYLGEWHYHPYSSSQPSSQDIQQMKEISSSIGYHCPEPILIIIGGHQFEYEIKVFMTNKGKFFELPIKKL